METLRTQSFETRNLPFAAPKRLRLVEAAPLDHEGAQELAAEIFRLLLPFRRMAAAQHSCGTTDCPSCLAPHLEKTTTAVLQGQRIRFALPAFPGKSPNPAKVLGPLPDMAERLALQFLNALCERIQQIYAPGAEMILCSDGRVFSDVIGMREEDVTAYGNGIDRIVAELGLHHISSFTLDELCDAQDFGRVRTELMEQYGKPLELLREKVRRGAQGEGRAEDTEANRMYCGITRFLVEDATTPSETRSRSAIQKDCRVRAYEVIRRSNAWSELIADRFPHAVRLSIHPQACGAQKLGIQLLGANSWMTPWHGVAVETPRGFALMKRWEAEELSAELVHDPEGRASHYRLAHEL